MKPKTILNPHNWFCASKVKTANQSGKKKKKKK